MLTLHYKNTSWHCLDETLESFADLGILYSGYSLRPFKSGSQRLPMWSKGVLDYDSEVCCFKEVKTTAKILIILAF